MAYQTRGREPLLDGRMQEMLAKRGREVVGIGLIGVAVLLAAMLWSYVPEDPNWMAATDASPQNILGRTGASVSALLMMIIGYASWLLPIGAFVWGARFLAHAGQERVLGRAIFLPIAVALAAIYGASLVPPMTWTHTFGVGGLFGDTILGAVLSALPIAPQSAIKVLAFVTFFAALFVSLFCLGVTKRETGLAGRFVYLGLAAIWAGILYLLRLTGRGAGAAATGAVAKGQAWREARAERAAAANAEGLVHRADGDVTAFEEPTSGSIFSRLPILRGDNSDEPVQSLSETELDLIEDSEMPLDPDEDRVRSRINNAIRARVRRPNLVADVAARARVAPGTPSRVGRVEPPLTAAQTEAPMAEVDVVDLPGQEPDEMPTPMDVGPLPSATPTFQRRVIQQPTRKPAAPSKQALADQQPSLPLAEPEPYEFPPLTLLADPKSVERHHLSDEALEENARMLENVLDDYGVKGEIVSVRPGPVVTMYELEPAPGLKASRVIGLADDIARSMSALSARVSTVPGRTVIGIELPNQNREMVVLREILSHRDFGDGKHKLPLALGKDIGGEPIIANLAKMPHLLIAGTTGSGKSVAINTMILSLLYKLTPEDCRMIMIDPKMLELSVYDGIPHLLSPVVTDPKKAVVALKWVVGEMEERYRKMSKMGVRNIDGYNGRVKDALDKGEMFSRTFQTGFDEATGEPVFETEEYHPEKMPYIVVIVDEMADLMMVAGKEIEACIQRLAQMARASGIHLVMATQRPSVDVITGTIKANFPTRISFHVTSKVDSRTILGEMGAEQLLGMGDMLYMAGGSKITRVHGPFCSDEEVEEIVSHLKSFGPPEYATSVLDGPAEDRESDIDAVLGLNTGGNTNGEDALYDQAVQIVIKDRKCSTSYIQRKLGIGYNKAARLVEQMEDQGLVSSANHVGKREILVPEQD